MISQIANIHLCPTEKAMENLNLEGINLNVHLVGNTIVDSHRLILNNGKVSSNIEELVDNTDEFYLCTLHRRENREYFIDMWNELNEIAEYKKIIYITHPSVQNSREYLSKKIEILKPINYQDMIYLIDKSKGVISDSGGIQEEVVCMKKKILICRNNTERPETVSIGTNEIIGTNPDNIKPYMKTLFEHNWKKGSIPELWDGNTATRIIEIILGFEK